MSVLNPQHLIEQAGLLLAATPGRKPRQVNLRRSVSSAYYAVFHHVLIAAGDEIVEKGQRSDSRYLLVYRGIEHADIRRACTEAARPIPSQKYKNCLPPAGFGTEIRSFANIFLRLQQLRHEADYDPSQYMTSIDSLFSIHLGRTAIDAFDNAATEEKRLFITVMLFPPR